MSHFFVSSRVEEMDKNMTALFIIDPFFNQPPFLYSLVSMEIVIREISLECFCEREREVEEGKKKHN